MFAPFDSLKRTYVSFGAGEQYLVVHLLVLAAYVSRIKLRDYLSRVTGLVHSVKEGVVLSTLKWHFFFRVNTQYHAA